MYTHIDVKELNLPDTTFIRDIDNRVFQSIVIECLSKIEGISFTKGVFEAFWGKDSEKLKGIYVEQDQKKHSIYVRIELNICYGVSIPQKAEEIQSKIVEELSRLTGLHVSCVHVVFKSLIVPSETIKESEVALSGEYGNF